jgi:hypothetical protein
VFVNQTQHVLKVHRVQLLVRSWLRSICINKMLQRVQCRHITAGKVYCVQHAVHNTVVIIFTVRSERNGEWHGYEL